MYRDTAGDSFQALKVEMREASAVGHKNLAGLVDNGSFWLNSTASPFSVASVFWWLLILCQLLRGLG